MLTDQYNHVLPGMEDLHVGLRQVTCECGCGEIFWQTRVGRVRKYVNRSHKERAYRANKQAARDAEISPDELAQLKGSLESYEQKWRDIDQIAQRMLDGSLLDFSHSEVAVDIIAILDRK